MGTLLTFAADTPGHPKRLGRIGKGLAALWLVPGCGDAGGARVVTGPTGSAPGGGMTGIATITIANNAVGPQSVTMAPGGRVTFVNSDSRAHDMSSDPHPDHADCPEVNQVGYLAPGQSRTSGNLNVVGQCGFHDHLQPGVAALRGTITIRAQ